MQQAAKNQLQEMEHLRIQQGPMINPPEYNNVEDVQQDVSGLMNRMKALSDFINSQNDLADSLGNDRPELLEEHTQLQKKLVELKNRKEQMANLVNELQSLNSQADNSFGDPTGDRPSSRNPSAEHERRPSPIDILQNPSRYSAQAGTSSAVKTTNDILAALPADADDEDIEDAAAEAVADSILHDKIAEINSMKNQLKRLQDMMETVKLIEIKNGEYNADEDKEANNTEQPQRDDEEREMAERVSALHSMTNDLRQQAVSLAAERDRLKDIKNEMARRREYDSSEKNIKQQQQQQNDVHLKEQDIEVEYENKKKEYRAMVDNLNSSENQREKKSGSEPIDSLFYPGNWNRNKNPSTTSSLRGEGRQSDTLSKKTTLSSCNPGKDSADSGAADVLNMSLEAGSLQSGSSRGFSVPPPMRNINARECGE